MAQFITAVAIELEALTPSAAVFLIVADDFDDALEAAEKRQTFVMQADQQIVMRKFLAAVVQHHRHLSGFCCIATAMRDEGGGRKVPQQSIQRVGERRARCAEHYTYTVLHGSVAQLAGGAL